MGDSRDPDEFDDLGQVLADYFNRLDRGEFVDRDALVASHPEHASALRRCFADIDYFAAEAAPWASPAAVASPRVFGDYELVDEIGRGGMGIVYRARERSTGRLVALKMLLHGLFVSPEEALRFRNEARTAASLDHPGIVPIFHAGESQGRLFYTMPLVVGSNLAQRLGEQPLAPKDAASLLLQIADAVQFAHSRGVVHRDLKPANILLDEHDQPFVADFGLARRFGDESLGLTVTGDLLGTPNYMAPEQINGRTRDVGPATDVYALGAVLYATLVGRPPFKSESVSETLQKICDAEAVPPRQLNRSVPGNLEIICLKCLEKAPASRYPSVHDLADDLRRFLAGEPLRAQRVSRTERCRRWLARNPVVGTLAVALAVALVAGAGFSTFYAARANQRASQALASLYAADMHLAQQHVQSGAVSSAIEILERHRPSGGADEAAWEWRHLWRQCHGELRQFARPRGAVNAAVFSPDGRLVAAAGEDRAIWIWETGTGAVSRKLAGHAAAVSDLCFTPDSRRLASVGDDGVTSIWDVETGARLGELRDHTRPPTTMAMSTSGSLLATAGREDAAVNLWDLSSYELVQSLALGPAEKIAFSPDEARLAVAGRDGHIRVWRRDQQTGWQTQTSFRAHDDIARDVAWSSDGARLATGGADRLVKVWNTSDWTEVATLGPLKNSVYSVCFSPNNERLAVAERDQPVRIWDIASGSVDVELRGHTSLVTTAAFCPDGWRLLTASDDGTVRLWDAARSPECDVLEGHRGQVRTIAFSGDGRTLASGGAQDGVVILWDPGLGVPLRVLRPYPTAKTDVAFSPDGQFLCSASHLGMFSVWRVATGELLLDVRLGDQNLESVAWAPHGRHVAVYAIDGVVRLVAPSDGQVVASWKAAPPGERGCVAFSHDGRLLLTAGSDASVRVWNVATGSLIHGLSSHEAATVGAVFGPDDLLIASSSTDRTLRLWNAASGRLVHSLSGHIGTTFGPAFSPDGRRLASASTDQSVRIWDVETGLELQSLLEHTDWSRDVAFSPDGQCLVSAGYDGTVRVWHGGPQNAERSAKREAAALVRHLATLDGERDPILAAIEGDPTIDDAVRRAAMLQASDRLLAWTSALAGHEAAERQDWATAVAKFKRTARLEPDDIMHWFWLAMASLAGGDQAGYRIACEAMIDPDRFDSDRDEVFSWTYKAWLAGPHAPEEMLRLLQIFDSRPWRTLAPVGTRELLQVHSAAEGPVSARPPTGIDPHPESYYPAALVYHLHGQLAEAARAYEAGLRLQRSNPASWEIKVFHDGIRQEVARVIGAETSVP